MHGDRAYWEARAQRSGQAETQEWFLVGLERLRPHLERTGALDASTSVLEAGCGTSRLALDLCDARGCGSTGTGSILAFDYSETCIKRQRMRLQQLGRCEQDESTPKRSVPQYRTMDARDLPLDDCTYDVLIDKGTLDAVDCIGNDDDAAAGARAAARCAAEYARVLRPGGWLCIVTCRSPRHRLEALAQCGAALRLESCEALKHPSEARAPGGWVSLLLLQRPVGEMHRAALDATALDQFEREQEEQAARAAMARAAVVKAEYHRGVDVDDLFGNSAGDSDDDDVGGALALLSLGAEEHKNE